ncbi:MAG: type II toxin-antitoxin system PemK/MazF family toxin [Actinomycetota bacterium]|nr:type II toxin-antitoxin system PemK/MazF family toxin [Actinomycetota bacterium]
MGPAPVPILILTRDPVADSIGSVVVAAIIRTRRALISELELTAAHDGLQSLRGHFDNLHTVRRDSFRRQVATLSPFRLALGALGDRRSRTSWSQVRR